MKNNKGVFILLVVLFLILIVGFLYLGQNLRNKTEVLPAENTEKVKPTETQSKETQEERLVDNVYIEKPLNWGEKKVEEKIDGAYTEKEIQEKGPLASCDLTRIKFKKFIQSEEDQHSYDDSIFIGEMNDFKRFYDILSKEENIVDHNLHGPNKLKEIYNKRKVEEVDFYLRYKDLPDEYSDRYMLLIRWNAAMNIRKYGYVENQDGSFRGFWILATFHQSSFTYSEPYFISVITDGEKVVDFQFVIKFKESEDFRKKYEEFYQLSNDPEIVNKEKALDQEYDKFLKENVEIQNQIDQLIAVVKSIHKK